MLKYAPNLSQRTADMPHIAEQHYYVTLLCVRDGQAPGLLNLDILCSNVNCIVHLHAESHLKK